MKKMKWGGCGKWEIGKREKGNGKWGRLDQTAAEIFITEKWNEGIKSLNGPAASVGPGWHLPAQLGLRH